jgi:hypothetical protein
VEQGYQKYQKQKKDKVLVDCLVNYLYVICKLLSLDDSDSLPLFDESFESESFQSKYLHDDWCAQVRFGRGWALTGEQERERREREREREGGYVGWSIGR